MGHTPQLCALVAAQEVLDDERLCIVEGMLCGRGDRSRHPLQLQLWRRVERICSGTSISIAIQLLFLCRVFKIEWIGGDFKYLRTCSWDTTFSPPKNAPRALQHTKQRETHLNHQIICRNKHKKTRNSVQNCQTIWRKLYEWSFCVLNVCCSRSANLLLKRNWLIFQQHCKKKLLYCSKAVGWQFLIFCKVCFLWPFSFSFAVAGSDIFLNLFGHSPVFHKKFTAFIRYKNTKKTLNKIIIQSFEHIDENSDALMSVLLLMSALTYRWAYIWAYKNPPIEARVCL